MEMHFTAIATLVAIIVASTGYQQHLLAREKLKFDLFEKRFSIYKGVQRFLSVILSNATYSMDDLFEFRRSTQDGTFLFRKDIPAYISEIDSKALKFKSTAEQLKDIPKGDKRNELVQANMQLLTELTDELPRLKEVFAPYLRFDKWK